MHRKEGRLEDHSKLQLKDNYFQKCKSYVSVHNVQYLTWEENKSPSCR